MMFYSRWCIKVLAVWAILRYTMLRHKTAHRSNVNTSTSIDDVSRKYQTFTLTRLAYHWWCYLHIHMHSIASLSGWWHRRRRQEALWRPRAEQMQEQSAVLVVFDLQSKKVMMLWPLIWTIFRSLVELKIWQFVPLWIFLALLQIFKNLPHCPLPTVMISQRVKKLLLGPRSGTSWVIS